MVCDFACTQKSIITTEAIKQLRMNAIVWFTGENYGSITERKDFTGCYTLVRNGKLLWVCKYNHLFEKRKPLALFNWLSGSDRCLY